jgi:hypothetical protein
MPATIDDPKTASLESGDAREEWSTPRVIVSEIRSTDKTYDLHDAPTDTAS